MPVIFYVRAFEIRDGIASGPDLCILFTFIIKLVLIASVPDLCIDFTFFLISVVKSGTTQTRWFKVIRNNILNDR